MIVNPAYPFDESPDNTATLEMHSGAVTASIQVVQNSQVIPTGGTILRSAVTTITGNGACAPGQSCFYLWGGEAVVVVRQPRGQPAVRLHRRRPTAFGAGFRTVSLSGTASPSNDTAFATTNFTVSDCASPTAPVNTTPSAGASVPAGSVQLIWNPSSGTAPINYTVKNSLGTTLCGPTTGTSLHHQRDGPGDVVRAGVQQLRQRQRHVDELHDPGVAVHRAQLAEQQQPGRRRDRARGHRHAAVDVGLGDLADHLHGQELARDDAVHHDLDELLRSTRPAR